MNQITFVPVIDPICPDVDSEAGRDGRPNSLGSVAVNIDIDGKGTYIVQVAVRNEGGHGNPIVEGTDIVQVAVSNDCGEGNPIVEVGWIGFV